MVGVSVPERSTTYVGRRHEIPVPVWSKVKLYGTQCSSGSSITVANGTAELCRVCSDEHQVVSLVWSLPYLGIVNTSHTIVETGIVHEQ